MKLKHLTRQGNSLALIIDRPILELLDIDEKTQLKLTTDKGKLIIEPVGAEEIERRFNAAADKVEKRFGPTLKRLAR
jgi:antitoxin MazE